VQEGETANGKVRVEREQEWVEGTVALNGIIMIIKCLRYADVRTNSPRDIVNHTDQSDESFQ
jgi:hypothetical protein